MSCLNCSKPLNHTPGKRKKQFCNPDCRVRYWQKNKPKPILIDLPADYVNVKKVGILKADGTVAELDLKNVPEGAWKTAMIAMLDLSKYSSFLTTNLPTFISTGQNKPLPAPPTEKLAESTLNQNKGKEGAENGGESDPGVMHWIKKAQSEGKEVGVQPAGPLDDHMPEGLTPIQQAVWRNNHKMKNKSAPITEFGVTKKEKK